MLVRVIARAFYQPKEIVVLDILAKYPWLDHTYMKASEYFIGNNGLMKLMLAKEDSGGVPLPRNRNGYCSLSHTQPNIVCDM